MRFIDADRTRDALPFDRLIAALRERFAGGCEVPPRHVHEITNPATDALADVASSRMTSLIMPAWLAGRYYGVKIVNIAPGNARRGLSALHSSYLLFDSRSGVPLVHIDGDQITARRTAAASALAGSYLARENASHLLLVGAGRVARLLPAAYRAVRPIERVTVWARRADEVCGTLTTLCKGVAAGRKSQTERTVFKSVGNALEDLAAAVLVQESAES